MPDRERPVLCCGELLIDLIANDGADSLERVEHFAVQPGGAPANVAVALSRLGIAAAFCGVVGDDPFGVSLRDSLRLDGVRTDNLRLASGESTTIAYAWKNRAGDGEFQLVRLADRLLDVDDIESAGIEHAAALVVGSVALSAEPSGGAVAHAVELASDAGVRVCFDLNVRPTLWQNQDRIVEACEPMMRRATVLKLSLDDARALGMQTDTPEAIVESLLQTGARIVVLTDGSRGVWASVEGNTIEHLAAHPVESIEPTGAGDAFTAALISRLLMREWSQPHLDDLQFAAVAGALATTRRGAMASLPTLEVVERELERSAGSC